MDSETIQHHRDHHNTVSEAGASLCSQQKDETAIIIHVLQMKVSWCLRLLSWSWQQRFLARPRACVPPHPLLLGTGFWPLQERRCLKTEGPGLPSHSDFPPLRLSLLGEKIHPRGGRERPSEPRNATHIE